MSNVMCGMVELPETRAGNVIYGVSSPISLAMFMRSEIFGAYASAYVTCLDSNRESVGVGSPDFRRYTEITKVAVHTLGGGVVMTGQDLMRLATTTGLFNEFDEVWFSHRPFTAAYDPGLYGSRWEVEIGKEASPLLSWMRTASVEVGMRDGIGFEYLTSDAVVAGALDSLSEISTEAVDRFHQSAADRKSVV